MQVGDRVKIKTEVFQERHFLDEKQLKNAIGVIEEKIKKNPDGVEWPHKWVMDFKVRFKYNNGRSEIFGFYENQLTKVKGD